MVKPALILPPEPDDRWNIAAQMGVEKAVIHPLEIGDNRTHWSYDELLRLSNWLNEVGIDLSVIEGSVPISDRVRIGAKGRDEDIEEFKQFLYDCGEVGIPVVCYDWMSGVRWARTSAFTKSRGGSYVTAYSSDAPGRNRPPDGYEDVTHEDLWEALEYFLHEVVPVAEAADVKLGLHPDDPPLSDLRGMPRIINSVDAYDRVIDIIDSPYNGITFC